MKKYYDLTMPLSTSTPVYPGDPAPLITQVANNEQYYILNSSASLSLHAGTHVDAPKHFIPGGASIDSFPLSRFACRGVLVKAEGEKIIPKELFQKTEILRGDALLVWTSHTEKARFKDYFQTNPVISEEAAQYLAEKKPSLVGIDSFSVDNPPFQVHKILLENDMLIVENLAGLKQLAGKQFKLLAFPLKLEGAEASPCRVVAEVIEE